MKNILITGGAGFIGSNFISFLKGRAEGGVNIINLDLLTYAGDLRNLEGIDEGDDYTFIEGDIREIDFLRQVFSDYEINNVIHFAAESHVDNSISGPSVFIDTNITGTHNLLQVANEAWMEKPFRSKRGFENSRFLHISTDEVYGSLGPTGFFTESTPYAPNSPYSASKASADMLVRSYHHTYGLNTVITNCSNNYGPRQHQEKLIPTIIRKALAHEPIPIYGDGKNIRDWLYVSDHCKGVWCAFEKAAKGEVYNLGGDNERDNIYIADKVCSLLDKLIPSHEVKSYKHLIRFVEDRAGHDRRYAVDSAKAKSQLDWSAEVDFEAGLRATVEWYIERSSGA